MRNKLNYVKTGGYPYIRAIYKERDGKPNYLKARTTNPWAFKTQISILGTNMWFAS